MEYQFYSLFSLYLYILHIFLNSKRIQDMKVHALGFIISLRILYGLKYFESLTQGQQSIENQKVEFSNIRVFHMFLKIWLDLRS